MFRSLSLFRTTTLKGDRFNGFFNKIRYTQNWYWHSLCCGLPILRNFNRNKFILIHFQVKFKLKSIIVVIKNIVRFIIFMV